MRCLNPVRTHCPQEELPKFPSPLGDEVLKPWDTNSIDLIVFEFPSPLGDEVLKPKLETVKEWQHNEFPSPLGDEVLKPYWWLYRTVWIWNIVSVPSRG